MECIKPWDTVKNIMKREKSLEKYVNIISDFISGKVTVAQFEELFLRTFKNENKNLDIEIYDILNKLFSDIDAYCGDPGIANYNKSDPFHDIDEKELLNNAQIALKKLLKVP